MSESRDQFKKAIKEEFVQLAITIAILEPGSSKYKSVMERAIALKKVCELWEVDTTTHV